MTAPGAMSERQLQKLLTEGKFPEVTQKEDVKSGSKSKKGRGKSATTIPIPQDKDTTSTLPAEASESKGTTKPITDGKGKAKTDAKGKRKMDTNYDEYHDVVTPTTTPIPFLGRKIVIIVCCSTINYLLHWMDEIKIWSCSWNKKLCILFTQKLVIVLLSFFFICC